MACSGGLDSVLLLWALATLIPQRIQVIHVNHGLHPDANRWADRVAQLCADWGIPCTLESVAVEAATGNLEARAREARYSVFAQFLKPNDVLWMAHHLNDQVETFLMHLSRGAGLDGLQGIPQHRTLGQGLLVRPWLQLPKAILTDAAQILDLQWIEDPANANLAFDRNFVRHEVLPILLSRWPHLLQSVATAQMHLTEAQQSLSVYYEAQLRDMLAADGSLLLDPWFALASEPLQLSLLRLWLRRFMDRLPGFEQLRQIRTQVALSRPDAQGCVSVAGGSIRRFQQRLYWVKDRPEPPLEVFLSGSAEAGWVGEHASFGRFSLEPCVGAGVALDQLRHITPVIRFRCGGEQMRPQGRQHHRDVKRLMQEYQIPPWWRSRMPLLFVGQDWVCLGDHCIAAEWVAAPDQPGLQPRWQPD